MELVKEDRYERSHPSRMISLIWDVQSRQIHRQICGCLGGGDIVKAMVFPLVMYGRESWTIKMTAEELMPLNCGAGEDS